MGKKYIYIRAMTIQKNQTQHCFLQPI